MQALPAKVVIQSMKMSNVLPLLAKRLSAPNQVARRRAVRLHLGEGAAVGGGGLQLHQADPSWRQAYAFQKRGSPRPKGSKMMTLFSNFQSQRCCNFHCSYRSRKTSC